MKKIFAIMMIASVLSLASCGGNTATEVSTDETVVVDSVAVDSTVVETLIDTATAQ